MEKLTSFAERLAHQLVASSVIVEAKRGKFEAVFETIRSYLGENRVTRILQPITQQFQIFPLLRGIRLFNYVSTFLPREWIFDLAQAREVEKIYPNTIKYALQYPVVPSEGIFEHERGIFKEIAKFTTTLYTKQLIGADVANQKGYNGSGVRVVVADTGLSRRHPATRHMMLDSVMAQVHDENGHGEWCSACVGGVYAEDKRLGRLIKRRIPTEGMAPGCEVVGIKCLGYVIGMGDDGSIIKAMEIGFSKYKADVLSMSLGGPIMAKKQEEDPYYKVIKRLTDAGVVCCVAAGNEGPGKSTIGTPGWLDDALTVGAYDPINGNIANFSSRGPTPDGRIKPDCVAPGVNIHAPIVGWLDRAGDNTNNQFSPISGTSMATPHVSGLLACMRQAHSMLLGKTLTTEEVKMMLQELGESKNNDSGYGLLHWSMYESWLETEYSVVI